MPLPLLPVSAGLPRLGRDSGGAAQRTKGRRRPHDFVGSPLPRSLLGDLRWWGVVMVGRRTPGLAAAGTGRPPDCQVLRGSGRGLPAPAATTPA
ncbi:hypothetical protein, partial [Frankia gtarii]|uniref:hypothetical protein n=1 Tax=Frankia gtarii TaxID=2950102 RepID=UPI0021C2391A